MNLTEEQSEAFAWGLDVLFEELEYYISYCNFDLDYGNEWPDVARERARHMRVFAEWTPFKGDAERWKELADRYEDSINPDEPLSVHESASTSERPPSGMSDRTSTDERTDQGTLS